MEVVIVGVGCKKCDTLTANTEKALVRIGLEGVIIERVQDLDDIANLGVVLTPALIVDNVLLSGGTVPTVGQLERQLRALLQLQKA